MGLNFNHPVVDFNKMPLINQQTGRIVMLKDAIIDCLGLTPQTESVSIEEKIARYRLGKKVYFGDDTTEYADEELDLIKTVLGKYAQVVFVGNIMNYIENGEFTPMPEMVEIQAATAEDIAAIEAAKVAEDKAGNDQSQNAAASETAGEPLPSSTEIDATSPTDGADLKKDQAE